MKVSLVSTLLFLCLFAIPEEAVAGCCHPPGDWSVCDPTANNIWDCHEQNPGPPQWVWSDTHWECVGSPAEGYGCGYVHHWPSDYTVPAVSAWGIAILILLLITGVTIKFGRRGRALVK